MRGFLLVHAGNCDAERSRIILSTEKPYWRSSSKICPVNMLRRQEVEDVDLGRRGGVDWRMIGYCAGAAEQQMELFVSDVTSFISRCC